VQDSTSSQTKTSQLKKPAPIVRFQNGKLTVIVKDRSLAWILDSISQRTKIAITTNDLSDPRISIDLQDLPVEQALRLILQGYDSFFYYGGEKDGPTSVRAVWVYPNGRAQGVEPVPPEKWASTKEFERRVTDPRPGVRAQAVEALIERKGPAALPLATGALRDPDAGVRVQALYSGLENDLKLPPEMLRDLVLQDPSVEVRVLALQNLAGSSEARDVAQSALYDADPNVRTAAKEVLGIPPSDTNYVSRRH
jgi:hypothetical protein